jgi:hypothetical protein
VPPPPPPPPPRLASWGRRGGLIEVCGTGRQVPALLARLPDHFMGEFFRAQLYVDLHLWESAATILDGPTLQRFPRSPFVACLRAFCLYSTQRALGRAHAALARL